MTPQRADVDSVGRSLAIAGFPPSPVVPPAAGKNFVGDYQGGQLPPQIGRACGELPDSNRTSDCVPAATAEPSIENDLEPGAGPGRMLRDGECRLISQDRNLDEFEKPKAARAETRPVAQDIVRHCLPAWEAWQQLTLVRFATSQAGRKKIPKADCGTYCWRTGAWANASARRSLPAESTHLKPLRSGSRLR